MMASMDQKNWPKNWPQSCTQSWPQKKILHCLRVAAICFCLAAASCTWRSGPQSSVLVILAENLPFGSFSCGEGSDGGRPDGFRAFCEESVRFTHAYTPSVMSQATVASLLTAKYPFEHRVRHNGAQSLASREETFAEQALARGFHTGFFSGGPPIWRRSGLNQGFEVFDDNFNLSLRWFYRNASETVKSFRNWLDAESAHEKFAAFLYLADLQFTDATAANVGDVRDNSVHSQMDDIDEALSALVKDLKRRKLWDSTEVFLIGLQGDPTVGRVTDLTPMNLFSEVTRATLMVKPARKQREGPFNWKIDANVSLVDVGATLFEFIGAPRTRPGGGDALVHSLAAAFAGPQPDWSLERSIISESAWASWRGLGGIRAAVRRGPYFFFFDETPSLYNTLTDNPEVTPMPPGDLRTADLRTQFSNLLKSYGYAPWKPLPRSTQDKAALAQELWRDREPSPEVLAHLRELSERFSEDSQLQGWRATWAVRLSDWKELKAVSSLPTEQADWAYVAARNLGEKAQPPRNPCFQFLTDVQPTQPGASPAPGGSAALRLHLSKECRVDGAADLFGWSNDTLAETLRVKAMEAFIRFYLARFMAVKIEEHNQVYGRTWDTAATVDSPDTLDLMMALPEFKRQRAAIRTIVKESQWP